VNAASRTLEAGDLSQSYHLVAMATVIPYRLVVSLLVDMLGLRLAWALLPALPLRLRASLVQDLWIMRRYPVHPSTVIPKAFMVGTKLVSDQVHLHRRRPLLVQVRRQEKGLQSHGLDQPELQLSINPVLQPIDPLQEPEEGLRLQ